MDSIITSYILRALVIFASFGSIYYIITSLPGYGTNEDLWSTNDDAPPDIKEKRVTERGILTSLISAFFLTIVGIIMVYLKVPEYDIEVLFGFIFAPVFGFMLDVGIGTDEGLKRTKTNILHGINYAMQSLTTSKFPRFVLTFLLDMFITKPIASVFKGYLIPTLEKVQPSKSFGWLDGEIFKNLTSIVQSIIGFITFQSYSSQTRFKWAYPGPGVKIIDGFIIMICTAIAAVFYLVSYSLETSALPMNLIIVMSTFVLMSILSATGNIDPDEGETKVKTKEETKEETKVETKVETSTHYGYIIFGLFVFIGVIYPILFRRISQSGDLKLTDKLTDPITINIINTLKR